jgi:Flp pilus assembly protein TadG
MRTSFVSALLWAAGCATVSVVIVVEDVSVVADVVDDVAVASVSELTTSSLL